nr:retrovirus-related Pol polyprotein from transposon TNT 1-94 [Tanacetum cinerariifolium]
FLVQGNPQHALEDKGVIDSACSRHMIRNMSYLSNFEEIKGGYVAFGEADFSNLETTITVSHILTTRVHKDHPVTQIIGDLSSATQIRSMTRIVKDQGGLTQINNEDFYTCMFACFLSQEEPKRMDVKSAFLYETIKEEVYVCQPTRFEDPDYPNKVYKVVKALYGLHQAPRACQDKYVAEILRKFGLTNRKSARTPIDTEKPLLKDPDGIKREFSVPRTPQQNGITERKNRTFIEAARTMLADSLLLISFWAEAVNTACYVQNRVLVTKPHNKTPYKLLLGRPPSIGFMRPFGCPNIDGDAAFDEKEPEFEGRKHESKVNISLSSSAQSKKHDDKTKREAKGKSPVESLTGYRNLSAEFEDFSDNSINEVNVADSLVFAVGQISTNNTNTFSAAGPSNAIVKLEDITYSDDEEDVGVEDDFTNLETTITVNPILTTRVHKDHPVTQIIGNLSSASQTRSMTRVAKDQGGISQINNDDFHTWGSINYKEVFAPVARIKAIRLFLAYASFMGFMVNQIDVKSTFLYGTIKEEVYVCQPLGFEDPDHPDKVYKVVKALYGLHQAPRACHDKYVAEILRKFGLSDGKSASTPIDTEKPLLKDPDG